MDRIQELLTRLGNLSDAELSELEGLILTEFEKVDAEEPSSASVESMVALADAMEHVRGEVSRRNQQAEDLARQAAEASARVRGVSEASAAPDNEDDPALTPDPFVPPAEVTAPAPAPEPEPETEPEPDADRASEDEGEDEDRASKLSEITPEQQEIPVTASVQGAGGVVIPPADAAPVPSLRPGVTMTITAGADIPGYGSGTELADMDRVADAFAKRLHTLRNVQGGTGTQYTVATLSYSYPEDRQLSGDDPNNITRVNKVISPQAITAAAGVCAPLETVYDVGVCGEQDRPVRDALARFNADRGGVRIYGSPTLGVGAVGVWNTAGAATKTCADASCHAPIEIMLDAVYACLKFSNFTNRFFPEMVKANTDLAMINHAREADLNLIAQIKAASTAVTAPDKKVGITRQMVYTISNAAALLRRRHRLGPTAPVRAIVPAWVQDAIVADIALQMPGDGVENLAISETRVNEIFRARSINIAWSLDSWNANGALAPIVGTDGFEDEVSFALFPEGAFLFLDGGTLDLGVQRDATMLGANEYATFVETFEAVAKTGCESLWITSPVCVSGAAAALVDTACAAG